MLAVKETSVNAVSVVNVVIVVLLHNPIIYFIEIKKWLPDEGTKGLVA